MHVSLNRSTRSSNGGDIASVSAYAPPLDSANAAAIINGRFGDVDTSRDASGALTRPIAGQSLAVQRVLKEADQVAVTDSTVLLLGETGTGKELFATHIHAQSARRAHGRRARSPSASRELPSS